MKIRLSKLLDILSETLAARKGLLPLAGIIFVILNFILRVFVSGWLVETDLFLHLGIIIAILGIMLAWAL